MSTVKFDLYLGRFLSYTDRLAVLSTMRKRTPTIKREIMLCKREITYNRNRMMGKPARKTGKR